MNACPWEEGCVGENIKLKAEPVLGGFILAISVTEGEESGTESVQKRPSYVKFRAYTL